MNEPFLKSFITVCKHKSFSRASKELNLSQPAVTHHIQALEKYYDVVLFHRRNQRIELTEAGELLYRHACELLQFHDKMVQSLNDQKKGYLLKVGCSMTIAEHLIASIVSDFCRRHPSFRPEKIKLIADTGPEIAHKLYRNEIDLALVEGADHLYPFLKEAFYEDEVVFTVSADHPLASLETIDSERLEQQHWLVREAQCSLRQATDKYWACLELSDMNLKYEVYPNNQLIKDGILKGIAIGILSKLAVRNELASGALVARQLCPHPITRSFYIMQGSAPPSKIQRLFWDHVISGFERDM